MKLFIVYFLYDDNTNQAAANKITKCDELASTHIF